MGFVVMILRNKSYLNCHDRGDMLDETGDTEYHVSGISVLFDVAIDLSCVWL